MTIGHQSLSGQELEKLDAILMSRGGGRAMNVEELDGFFCALVMGPELAMPSEYLPVVWGGRGDAGAELKVSSKRTRSCSLSCGTGTRLLRRSSAMICTCQ